MQSAYIHGHSTDNNIYEPMQSAYIHGHSTETTFMNLCSLLTYMVIAQKQHL